MADREAMKRAAVKPPSVTPESTRKAREGAAAAKVAAVSAAAKAATRGRRPSGAASGDVLGGVNTAALAERIVAIAGVEPDVAAVKKLINQIATLETYPEEQKDEIAASINVNPELLNNPSLILMNSILLPVEMRASAPSGYTTDSLEPGVLLKPLTSLLTEILGDKMIDCLQAQFGTLRNAVEKSTPTTQCANVIDGDPTICWICGGIITEEEFLSFECEHIFPIAQALCFTGLYEHNIYKHLLELDALEGGNRAATYKKGLRREYGPAHVICNQAKNDSHFIMYNNSVGYYIDKSRIIDFLNKLKDTKSWGTGRALCSRLQATGLCKEFKTPQEYLLARADAIAQVCQSILDNVQSLGFSAEQHATLTAMHLKAFFANDPTCGSMQDILPDYTKFATPSSGSTLAVVNPPGYIEASQDYMTKNVDYFSNILVGELVKTLDGVSMPALTRAKIKLALAEKERAFKEKMKSLQITDEMKALALKCMVYLQGQTPTLDNKQLWSKFQIDFRQLILMEILDRSYTIFKATLNEATPLEFDFNDAIEELYNRDMLQFAGGLSSTPEPAEYTPSNTEMSEYSISSLTPEERIARIAKAKEYLDNIKAVVISPETLAATPPFFDKTQYGAMTGGKRKRRKTRRRKSIRRKTVNRRTRKK